MFIRRIYIDSISNIKEITINNKIKAKGFELKHWKCPRTLPFSQLRGITWKIGS